MILKKRKTILFTVAMLALLLIVSIDVLYRDNDKDDYFVDCVRNIEKSHRELKQYKATYDDYKEVFSQCAKIANYNLDDDVFLRALKDGEIAELKGSDLIGFSIEDLETLKKANFADSGEDEIMRFAPEKYTVEVSKVYTTYDNDARFVYVKEKEAFYLRKKVHLSGPIQT